MSRATGLREPAVAGTFYPAAPGALAQLVDGYLRDAARTDAARGSTPRSAPSSTPLSTPALPPTLQPKAIIAPHAGFVYSGAVAASAYATLAGARDRIRRVVLLGPSHRVALRGLAVPRADAFETPLGRVPVDRAACERALLLPQVIESDEAHAFEHSLEVHLPFLQRVLDHFVLVPFSVGAASAAEVAEVLEGLWGGDETLIVVSSDLSHYYDYATARRLDAATTRAIEAFDPDGLDEESACGRVPVRGLLLSARRHGLSVRTLDVRSSGDTAGPRDRVVGYGSWAFYAPARSAARGDPDAGEDWQPDHDETLLALARRAIAFGLDAGAPPDVDADAFAAPLRALRASFVTLRRDGALRGCIGSLEARLPLVSDVSRNAWRSAYRDPRFQPLARSEQEGLSVHVSVLGPHEPLSFASEAELLRQLRPGVDGLVLRDRGRHATFLPDVWESLPDPRDFLAQLLRKAGLPDGHWSQTLEVHRYTTRSIG